MSEKIVLKNVRLSYEHIFKADSIGDSDPKFSATWIIPKDHPQIKAVKEAIIKALDEKFPGKRKNGAWPNGFHNPLKDGDELADDHPEYAGCYILPASSRNRPLIIGRRKEAIVEEDGVIYSGCYCNASLAAAGFEYEKIKKGVTIYLNGVQFVQDGERLAGFDASGDFDDLDGDSNDYGDII